MPEVSLPEPERSLITTAIKSVRKALSFTWFRMEINDTFCPSASYKTLVDSVTSTLIHLKMGQVSSGNPMGLSKIKD